MHRNPGHELALAAEAYIVRVRLTQLSSINASVKTWNMQVCMTRSLHSVRPRVLTLTCVRSRRAVVYGAGTHDVDVLDRRVDLVGVVALTVLAEHVLHPLGQGDRATNRLLHSSIMRGFRRQTDRQLSTPAWSLPVLSAEA